MIEECGTLIGFIKGFFFGNEIIPAIGSGL